MLPVKSLQELHGAIQTTLQRWLTTNTATPIRFMNAWAKNSQRPQAIRFLRAMLRRALALQILSEDILTIKDSLLSRQVLHHNRRSSTICSIPRHSTQLESTLSSCTIWVCPSRLPLTTTFLTMLRITTLLTGGLTLTLNLCGLISFKRLPQNCLQTTMPWSGMMTQFSEVSSF